MKVVIAGTRGIPDILGGVETHCEELAPRLARVGVDVTVVRRKTYVKDNLSEWNGVKLVDIPVPRKKSLEAVVHTLRSVNFAAKVKADILHINAVGPAILVPYAKMLGLKVVFTHHGPDYDRDKWGIFAKLALRIGERMGCRHADEVIAISDVIRRIIVDKYGRSEGVHVIPNGVPSPVFCDYPEFFETIGLERGMYILAMSRFVPEKRLEDIIQAYERSGLKEKGYKLVLAGDADFEDDYSRKVKSQAHAAGVVLTGFVKGRKLHSLLSNASLYVLASSHEGLPIALLEAMSYHLPVLVSDIPANLEVNLPDEYYFKLGDVEMLSLKMQHAVTLSKKEYDMMSYNWDNIAKATLQVYSSLCN